MTTFKTAITGRDPDTTQGDLDRRHLEMATAFLADSAGLSSLSIVKVYPDGRMDHTYSSTPQMAVASAVMMLEGAADHIPNKPRAALKDKEFLLEIAGMIRAHFGYTTTTVKTTAFETPKVN